MVYKFIELNLERCLQARVYVNDKHDFPCTNIYIYERYNKIHLYGSTVCGSFLYGWEWCGGWRKPHSVGFCNKTFVLYFIEMCGLCAENVVRFFGVLSCMILHSFVFIDECSLALICLFLSISYIHFSDLCEKTKPFPFSTLFAIYIRRMYLHKYRYNYGYIRLGRYIYIWIFHPFFKGKLLSLVIKSFAYVFTW